MQHPESSLSRRGGDECLGDLDPLGAGRGAQATSSPAFTTSRHRGAAALDRTIQGRVAGNLHAAVALFALRGHRTRVPAGGYQRWI